MLFWLLPQGIPLLLKIIPADHAFVGLKLLRIIIIKDGGHDLCLGDRRKGGDYDRFWAFQFNPCRGIPQVHSGTVLTYLQFACERSIENKIEWGKHQSYSWWVTFVWISRNWTKTRTGRIFDQDYCLCPSLPEEENILHWEWKLEKFPQIHTLLLHLEYSQRGDCGEENLSGGNLW